MPIIGSKEMLDAAYAGKYAVGGFDAFNAESMKAVMEESAARKSPILMICAPIEYALLGAKMTVAVAKAVSDTLGVEACIHLDHAGTYELVVEAIDAGFKSVMIDGSQGEYESNVALTKKVVEYAHPRGVAVEAEIGAMGRVGKLSHEGDGGFKTEFTDPGQAKDFVEKTGCDFLAISIGNAHGLYTKSPSLQLDLLKEISTTVGIPLVLHGGSGTPEDQLKKAVSYGISKVNVASEIARDFNNVYLPVMEKGDTWWAVAKREAAEATKSTIGRWIGWLGSSGKA